MWTDLYLFVDKDLQPIIQAMSDACPEAVNPSIVSYSDKCALQNSAYYEFYSHVPFVHLYYCLLVTFHINSCLNKIMNNFFKNAFTELTSIKI